MLMRLIRWTGGIREAWKKEREIVAELVLMSQISLPAVKAPLLPLPDAKP
jgi:hypothetical protein